MKVVHMIDDYRDLCVKSGKVGAYPAYKAYTERHPDFFDGVFQYLYCQPIEALREYIEGIDFQALLQTAEANYAAGICDYIAAAAEQFAEQMHVDFEFDLLLGMELSNIGGCSTPRADGVPYLYIGIDRCLTKDFIDVFVPHEMHHMIHNQLTHAAEAETLLSRAAEEGTASYAPMWLYALEWNADSIARVLSISTRQAEFLLAHTDQLVAQALEHRNSPLTQELMQAYFYLTDAEAEIALPGYYIGLYFTHSAVKKGVDFNRFASMPNASIVELWLTDEALKS